MNARSKKNSRAIWRKFFRREVSLKSVKQLLIENNTNLGLDSELLYFQNNLEFDSFKLYDKIFIALHGNEGESGDLQQKLLEHNISFTGSHPQAAEKLGIKKFANRFYNNMTFQLPPGFLSASFNAISIFKKISAHFNLAKVFS